MDYDLNTQMEHRQAQTEFHFCAAERRKLTIFVSLRSARS
jgi:hypothetical protein